MMPFSRTSPLLVLGCLAACGGAGICQGADDLGFAAIRPLLVQHCSACHGTDKQEGGVNFLTFDSAASLLKGRETWRKAREALVGEEMPPDPAETKFAADDRTKLVEWIQAKIETLDRASSIYQDPGPALVRPLSRAEFINTYRDLIQIDYFNAADAAGIRDEAPVEGFANLAAGLTLDQLLLEKYFAAAEAALDLLFPADVGQQQRVKKAREALLVAKPSEGVSDVEAVRKVLTHFARRAFRRPATTEEIDRLLPFVERSLAAGEDFETAVRKGLKPILVSPHFLYRLEQDEPRDALSPAHRVNDHELAVRLSYFLWSTMPDDELFRLASRSELSQPEVLAAQVERMLKIPKAKALTDNFAYQWLQLFRLRNALPGRHVFPAFTGELKRAMEEETRTFFDKLREEDRSVLDLLDADYTYVNEDLARHYGLSDVKGREMKRVALLPEQHRGGLLGMASVLTMTSHVDRTRPTARGKWILETIFGTPPSPPPANVSNFQPKKNQPEPKNFREKLAQHAADVTCAGCHKKIDPLGFALENYDAIGSWREQVGGAAVDNVGKLPGAEEFRGVEGLKRLVQSRKPAFLKNLVSQMLSYALGREVDYYDELTAVQISEGLEKEEYRFSSLVRGIVNSRAFLYRANVAGEGP